MMMMMMITIIIKVQWSKTFNMTFVIVKKGLCSQFVGKCGLLVIKYLLPG